MLFNIPDLKTDPRFLTNQERVKNRSDLIATLNGIFKEKDAAGLAGSDPGSWPALRPDQHPAGSF